MSTKIIAQAPELRPFYIGNHHRSHNNKIPVITKGSNIEVAKRGKSVDDLMNKIETFFSKSEHMGKMKPFLLGESKISIRLIEWFVSVYSMNNRVDWFVDDGEFFSVYPDYQDMMSDNTKQLFDPFCRKWRKERRKNKKGESFMVKVYHGIKFYYTDTEYLITTVAQLNFFKWFISNKVLDYMIEHKDELCLEMNQYNHEKKKRKKENGILSKKSKSKLCQVSAVDDVRVVPIIDNHQNRKVRVQAMKRVTKRNVEVYVSFD